MGLIRADVGDIERREAMLLLAHPYPSASAHPDYHVAMAMTLEAGETAGLKLEVAQLESHWRAVLSDHHLARGAGKISAAKRA